MNSYYNTSITILIEANVKHYFYHYKHTYYRCAPCSARILTYIINTEIKRIDLWVSKHGFTLPAYSGNFTGEHQIWASHVVSMWGTEPGSSAWQLTYPGLVYCPHICEAAHVHLYHTTLYHIALHNSLLQLWRLVRIECVFIFIIIHQETLRPGLNSQGIFLVRNGGTCLKTTNMKCTRVTWQHV